MSTVAAKLKTAARRGIGAYLRSEDVILSALFFVGIAVMQIFIMRAVAKSRAKDEVFPISIVFDYIYMAVLLFLYGKSRVPRNRN